MQDSSQDNRFALLLLALIVLGLALPFIVGLGIEISTSFRFNQHSLNTFLGFCYVVEVVFVVVYAWAAAQVRAEDDTK